MDTRTNRHVCISHTKHGTMVTFGWTDGQTLNPDDLKFTEIEYIPVSHMESVQIALNRFLGSGCEIVIGEDGLYLTAKADNHMQVEFDWIVDAENPLQALVSRHVITGSWR